jgi:carbamate kinase
MTEARCLLLALGGNAIIPPGGAGTIEEQIAITEKTMRQVAEAVSPGARIVVTHGNGPIVGNIVLRNEAARETIPPMPLDVCGADSQGGLGYMIQQVMWNEFHRLGKDRDVTTIITRVRVEADDPAFLRPTKPIGPFYRREAADRLRALRGWQMIEDSGRGYRRVVPSPRPREIMETAAIQTLLEHGVVVIAAGGGGIPVVRKSDGTLAGIEAVVDKDRTAAVLARAVGADELVIVTGVDRVAIGYRSPQQQDLATLAVDDARKYLAAGEFPPGSMGPKVEAAIEFVESGGREAIITSSVVLGPALRGEHGTRIVSVRTAATTKAPA